MNPDCQVQEWKFAVSIVYVITIYQKMATYQLTLAGRWWRLKSHGLPRHIITLPTKSTVLKIRLLNFRLFFSFLEIVQVQVAKFSDFDDLIRTTLWNKDNLSADWPSHVGAMHVWSWLESRLQTSPICERFHLHSQKSRPKLRPSEIPNHSAIQ